MGEPARPNREERAATHADARALVTASTNDDAWPFPFDDKTIAALPDHIANTILTMVFRLAQDLVDTRAALDRACNALDLEGLDETAARLSALDLGDGEPPAPARRDIIDRLGRDVAAARRIERGRR